MHYTVKSWNELLSANTNKLKSSNFLRQGKIEAFRSRLGNWIMDSPCDNRRPVGRLDADT